MILNSSIHAGIRAQVVDKSDMRHDKDCGFHIITARDIDFIGVRGVIDRLRTRVEHTRVYISIDIDVLDPAFAPGTYCRCTDENLANKGIKLLERRKRAAGLRVSFSPSWPASMGCILLAGMWSRSRRRTTTMRPRRRWRLPRSPLPSWS